MKDCQEYAALLDAFIDGELSPEEMVRVQEHLDGCPGCRAYVDDLLAIRAAFPDTEDVEVPEGFAGAVSAAIRAGAAPRKKNASPWRRTLLPLAACCALVILLARMPAATDRMDAASSAPRSYGSAAQSPAGTPEDGAVDDAAPEQADFDPATEETAEDGVQSYADIPEAAQDRSGGAEERARDGGTANTLDSEGASPPASEGDSGAAGVPEPAALQSPGEAAKNGAPQSAPAETENPQQADEGWVEYGNVVFACVVYLSEDAVGDALEGFEGKSYRDANLPESGVIGMGYALETADFERILDELSYPLDPALNQERTTELRCIVVTE